MTERPSRTPFVLAGLVAALGLGAGAGIATYAALEDDSSTVVREVTVSDTGSGTSTATDGEGLSAAEIYERVHRGVVEISTTSFAGGAAAQGSGFVYDGEGHVVTNQHVVAGADEINVRFASGATYPAELVGTDRSTDLAVSRSRRRRRSSSRSGWVTRMPYSSAIQWLRWGARSGSRARSRAAS